MKKSDFFCYTTVVKRDGRKENVFGYISLEEAVEKFNDVFSVTHTYYLRANGGK